MTKRGLTLLLALFVVTFATAAADAQHAAAAEGTGAVGVERRSDPAKRSTGRLDPRVRRCGLT
jgi:hypothetical protein